MPVKLRDGVSDPAVTDILAGALYDIWYDGMQFRLITPMPSMASGSVVSVFGRQGAVAQQPGDYTTDQVTEGTANKFFTAARAQSAMAGLYQTPISGAPSSWPTLGTAAGHASTDFEPALANPSVSGYVLSSNTAGARSWVAQSGGVTSAFGRTGAVTAQSGDYTTDQVTEGGNLYYTAARALAAVTWGALTGKPSAFTASPHAASHQNGGSDEIATATPAANAIPKAGADGKLDAGWLPAGSGSLGYTAENVANKGLANGYAPLDSSAHVPTANTPALTGDVTKAAGNGAATVAGIQGRAVASTAPTDGQALIWSASGSQYVPATLATGNGTSSTNGTNGQPLTSDGSGGFGTPLTLVTTIGAQGADTSIPSEKAVRSAIPTLRTWNYVFQGADYGGVPVFAGNIPAAGAPTAKINASSDLAVLDFPTAQSTYYWYGSWRMPPAYPASGAISYIISSMCDPANCDSTHAANVHISLACSGTAARPDSPSYTELTAPIAITNNASGYQTVTTGMIAPGAGTPTLPACATTNRATIKLRVDTSANSLTGSFQLVAVGFYVQGQL